ncbi:MAG: hypothetical protein P8J32_01285 [bacterium]|nr:hypothetical protein [bacterium]
MKTILAFIGVLLLSLTSYSQNHCGTVKTDECIEVNWATDEVFYDGVIVMQRVEIKCKNEVIIHYPHDFTLFVFNEDGEKIESRQYKATGNSMPSYRVDINQCGGPIVVVLMSMELTMARKYYN